MSRSFHLIRIATAAVMLACGLQQVAHAASPASSVPRDLSCDRSCLLGHMDRYLEALRDRDPARLPWAPTARTTENNVQLMIGDGLWGTITGLGSYRLPLADPQNGEVALFGAVEETNATSPFAVRLRIAGGHIEEAETIVRREADNTPMAPARFDDKPVFQQLVPAARRLPRARLISLADGYFDTLQLNDGVLFTQFADNCDRVENGVRTTNNAELAEKLHFSLGLGCAEQFRLGNFRYDDRLRDRDHMLVDEERGLVLSRAMMDHAGRLTNYRLTDGREQTSRYLRPHSYYMLELFKINAEGRIGQIEAVFITVPYHMPSAWRD
jgi:hypothetical protein